MDGNVYQAGSQFWLLYTALISVIRQFAWRKEIFYKILDFYNALVIL